MAGALLFAPASAAVDDLWFTSDELGSDCLAFDDPTAPEERFVCIAYLQGFLAGTRAARGERIDTGAQSGGNESFSERAIRTRAGTYLQRLERGRSRGYCVPEDVPAGVVLDAIVEHLQAASDEAGVSAQTIVHAALEQRFPCARR